MSWKKFILRLIELIRPRFYNRLTWVVVVCGLTMMSTPLLERVFISVLATQLNLSISGDNDQAWGFALCLLGLVYHFANSGLYQFLDKERPDKPKKADEKTFNAFLADLSEETIRFVKESPLPFHSDRRMPLDEFRIKWNSQLRQFLNGELEGLRSELYQKIACYLDILSVETFPCHNNQQFVGIPPEWDQERQDNAVKRIYASAGEVVEIYDRFVSTARKHFAS